MAIMLSAYCIILICHLTAEFRMLLAFVIKMKILNTGIIGLWKSRGQESK